MYIFKIQLFGLTIAPTYYGLMYVFGFVFGYITVKRGLKLSHKKMDDLILYIFAGVILGGRIGYILFYDLSFYIDNPLNLIKIWEGGMSFHGGAIGVVLAMYFFAKKYKKSILNNKLELNPQTSKAFLKLTDEVCRSLPVGLGLGRLGNYLNKELLGYSPYDGPFAVYINSVGYFPSPLLEAILEGVILFLILAYFYKKKTEINSLTNLKIFKPWYYNIIPKNDGQIASLFLVFYAIFRIFVEIFFRAPDPQIGYIFGFLTMGEILTLPMLIVGIYYFIKLNK
ncbi:MAG: prolipoprotein diacylglyceryl transferase [Candidatus Gracilibacteria bacterium]